jgi:putative transposase
MGKRNRYTSEFKAKVVLEILRKESALTQVASKYQLNPQMISQWKSEFIRNASAVFEKNKDEAGKLQKEMNDKEARYQKIIGQTSYEIDYKLAYALIKQCYHILFMTTMACITRVKFSRDLTSGCSILSSESVRFEEQLKSAPLSHSLKLGFPNGFSANYGVPEG